jgi:hypothetical protein
MSSIAAKTPFINQLFAGSPKRTISASKKEPGREIELPAIIFYIVL